MSPLKIVFMGTPDFGLPTLKALFENPSFQICSVFSQPDPPKRGRRPESHSAIKKFALENKIPLHQPHSLRKNFDEKILRDRGLDFIVVAAYGKLLPKKILQIPRLGCINLHGSLLPKFRGAAPVQWAVIQGESRTGNTVMLMSEGLDEGDILSVREFLLPPYMTAGELYSKLSKEGAPLMVETLINYAQGVIKPLVQDHHYASLAPKISQIHVSLDFKRAAKTLHNLIRGLHPSPLAETTFKGQRVKVCESRFWEDGPAFALYQNLPFGAWLPVKEGNHLLIKTGDGILGIDKLKPAGKKEISGKDFINGFRLKEGDFFGDYFGA